MMTAFHSISFSAPFHHPPFPSLLLISCFASSFHSTIVFALSCFIFFVIFFSFPSFYFDVSIHVLYTPQLLRVEISYIYFNGLQLFISEKDFFFLDFDFY